MNKFLGILKKVMDFISWTGGFVFGFIFINALIFGEVNFTFYKNTKVPTSTERTL